MPINLQQQIAMRVTGRKKPRKPRLPKRNPFPRTAERDYTRLLVGVVKILRETIEEKLIAVLPALVANYNVGRADTVTQRDEALITDAQETSNLLKILKSVEEAVLLKIDFDAITTVPARSVEQSTRTVFLKQMKQLLGVDIFADDAEIKKAIANWASNNAFLIEDLNRKAIYDISQIVQSGFSAGLRHEQIAKEIFERIDDVTENRAAFIARDQVAKLNGELTKVRQTSLGLEKYIWSTAGDERVRPSHAAKDGRTFSWDDPPMDTGHPGEDYNCRCIALPIIPEGEFEFEF